MWQIVKLIVCKNMLLKDLAKKIGILHNFAYFVYSLQWNFDLCTSNRTPNVKKK
jgi:hypothetical protein